MMLFVTNQQVEFQRQTVDSPFNRMVDRTSQFLEDVLALYLSSMCCFTRLS